MWTSETIVMLLKQMKRMNWPNRYLKVRERLVASLSFDIAPAEMKRFLDQLLEYIICENWQCTGFWIRLERQRVNVTEWNTWLSWFRFGRRWTMNKRFCWIPARARKKLWVAPWELGSVWLWIKFWGIILSPELKVLRIFEAASNFTAGCLTKVLSHAATTFGTMRVFCCEMFALLQF